ncbi:aminoglycoside 2'-N-acetyltransferase I [Kitasatospora sp. MAA19]|uniref:GNAT family N-acetyltransferase n=1 Tax=unclassified Kitasatospora TaxID=2633591 RepID=UPI0024745A66|nr:GNAT family N-acetyltransferase [Kitasatospora sp. MAA19]MDH6708770.1 aminoglycoside 2'-N-acetyltransferase I [Kitasatospora sp. MAA19]
MQIVSFPEEATPFELRAQVRELQEQAWPSPPGSVAPPDAPTHDPALRPLSMLLVADGAVLAALDILSKELVHAGARFAAGGLSAVVTRREARGRGHGRHLVAAAREEMIARQLDVGLFTCDSPLQAFYGSTGWRVLSGTVLIGGTPQDPFPSDQPGFDKVTMADFFSPEGRRAEASFRDSRIELYPGEIDRLW